MHDVLDAPQFILDAQLLVLVAAHDVPALGVRLGGAEKFFDSFPRLSIGHSSFTDGEVYIKELQRPKVSESREDLIKVTESPSSRKSGMTGREGLLTIFIAPVAPIVVEDPACEFFLAVGAGVSCEMVLDGGFTGHTLSFQGFAH